jgi:Lon protease-like protein
VILPMFPLGTVLLPGQLLPLHVFEERYRALVDDVRDREPPIFGVVLIERGSEVGGSDVRGDVGTCARVLRLQAMDDGRWLMLVGGTNRIRVRSWLPDDPYPRAEIEDFTDPDASVDPDAVRVLHALHRRLAAMATEFGIGRFESTSVDGLDPELAVWTMIAESPLGPLDRQRLLAVPCVRERMAAFAELLKETERYLLMELPDDAG